MEKLHMLEDDVILPGFRFHPTEEELIGFYLHRKVKNKPLAIEVINQLDIYKFDPWELPGMAAAGEREWYFFCPRDRKYRNSNRPNRVTSGGFWKATGTDRPVYPSSNRQKCIGLKKSLVFYKGRASRPVKTDWMMHEFRLPTKCDDFLTQSPEECWTVCKIFKKTSPAQRTIQTQPPNLCSSEESQSTNSTASSSKSMAISPGKPELNLSFDSPSGMPPLHQWELPHVLDLSAIFSN